MAFYQDDEENQQNPDAQGGVAVSGQSSTISGQSAAPQGASAPKATAAPDKSGNFVGIKQYLDANQRQAAKLGDQTAQVVNTSADQARQSVNALRQDADQKIQGVGPINQDVFGKLNTGAETLTGDERNVLKSTANAKYSGPKSAAELGDTFKNAQKSTQVAQNNIQQSGTEEGRMGLISQINAKPRTQGMNVFDNALVQAGGGREKIANAVQQNQDIKGLLDTASADIQKKIGDENTGAIGQTKKSQAEAHKAIQDALANWQTAFTPKVQEAQKNLVNQQNAFLADLVDDPYQLEDSTLQELGLKSGDHTFGLNLQDYFKPTNPTDVTADNVASTEDYARYSALADLAGVAPSEMVLKSQNASKAGQLPGLGVDKDRLMADLNAANDKYQNLYQTYIPEYKMGDQSAWNELVMQASDQGALPTAQNIEKYIIPRFQTLGDPSGTPGYFTDFADRLKQEIAAWKEQQKYHNVINPQDAAGAVINPKVPVTPKIRR